MYVQPKLAKAGLDSNVQISRYSLVVPFDISGLKRSKCFIGNLWYEMFDFGMTQDAYYRALGAR